MATEDLPQDLKANIDRLRVQGSSILDSFLNENIRVQPIPQIVYHYTDWNGLRGILDDGTLRCGDIFYLNDPSELRHGVSASLDLFRAGNALSDWGRFGEDLKRSLSSNLGQIANIFILCFSQKWDDLSQWRAYGENGRGYAIGFDGRAIESAFAKEFALQAQTFPITYSDDKLTALHQKLIDFVETLMISHQRPDVDSAQRILYYKMLRFEFSVLVLSASLFFKHEAYDTESEYRFLQMHRVGPVSGVKFRKDKPNNLARYREFNWKASAPNSLKSIVVGPAADFGKAQRFADDCLKAFLPSQRSVAIERSKIPYSPQ